MMGTIDNGVQHMVSKLTLEEIEAIAVRLEQAARTIRDAQAMLAGGPGTRAPSAVVEAAASAGPLPPPSMFTQSELAERNRLLKQFKPDDMPPDVAAAMKDA